MDKGTPRDSTIFNDLRAFDSRAHPEAHAVFALLEVAFWALGGSSVIRAGYVTAEHQSAAGLLNPELKRSFGGLEREHSVVIITLTRLEPNLNAARTIRRSFHVQWGGA